MAGSYSLTVTDAAGCNATTNVIITQNPALSVSLLQTDVDCFGGATGSIAALVSGGLAPYSYAWSAGGTSAIKSNLSAGTYSVTVTDAAGCSMTVSATLTQPTAIAASISVTDAQCYGSSDGAVSVSVSGGTGVYSYSWNTGSTAQNLDSVIAGIYVLTITDENGTILTSLTGTDEHIIAKLQNYGVRPEAIRIDFEHHLNDVSSKRILEVINRYKKMNGGSE